MAPRCPHGPFKDHHHAKARAPDISGFEASHGCVADDLVTHFLPWTNKSSRTGCDAANHLTEEELCNEKTDHGGRRTGR